MLKKCHDPTNWRALRRITLSLIRLMRRLAVPSGWDWFGGTPPRLNAPGDDPEASFYRALTTLAQHCLMKIRDNMNAVIESLQKEHGLLAAYLEATDKINWRALHNAVVIAETPEPLNVEAQRTPTAPELPEVVPTAPDLLEVVPSRSAFVFRRANLVRIP